MKKTLSIFLAVLMFMANVHLLAPVVKASEAAGADSNVVKSSMLLASSSKKPGKVSGVQSNVYDSKSITLKWRKVRNASAYQVYKYNPKKKKYTKVKTVTNNKAKITSLKAGTTYKFKIRAYRKYKKKNYYGKFSGVFKKKTISNCNLKKRLVNGYLYDCSPQADNVNEYIFRNNGKIEKNYYEWWDGKCRRTSHYTGTYKIKNNVAYCKVKSGKSWLEFKLYYDKDKKIYRSFEYEYGPSTVYWWYHYEKNRVPIDEISHYYSTHGESEVEV